MRHPLVALALIVCVAPAGPALAGDDADWPCVQRLVPQISPAQVWTGPVPSPEMWADDGEVARLGAEIAARRMTVETAEHRIDGFASGLDSGRGARLTALFGRALQVINSDRASLIAGIKRFARKQASLAARVRETRVALKSDTLSDEKRADLNETLAWDLRIYEDREKSQKYLCEQPVLLEQRAFALGRIIGAHLDP